MQDWELTDCPSSDDEAVVHDGVFDEGRRLAVGGEARPLACFVKDSGKTIAGGVGRTEFRRLFVSSLWVSRELRGKGLGREILNRMEREALARGCEDVLIETLFETTALFYERSGYETISMIPNYVGTFARHIMVKSLGTTASE